MSVVEIFIGAMQQLIIQMAAFLPKVVIAVLIWLIGVYFLNLGVNLIKKVNIKRTRLDDQAIEFLAKVALPLGKFILVLIILDYLGVGRTVIGAFVNGLSFAIAIALGIAFGRALEEDASGLVREARKHLRK